MTWVITNNSKFYLHEDETLLAGLIRTGHDINYQCNEGYCGSCRIKLLANSHPITYAQPPLAMVEDTEVLSCCCQVKGVLKVQIESQTQICENDRIPMQQT